MRMIILIHTLKAAVWFKYQILIIIIIAIFITIVIEDCGCGRQILRVAPVLPTPNHHTSVFSLP